MDHFQWIIIVELITMLKRKKKKRKIQIYQLFKQDLDPS